MRFAFITPEFITDYPDGGGLGNYLNRMTKLLVDQGHSVELFLPSKKQPSVLWHNGVRVERVNLDWPLRYKIAARLLRYVPRSGNRLREIHFRARAAQLALAMESRHRVQPFDVVQSADYLAVGLAVQRRPKRIHVIRCSCPIDLYNQIDGNHGPEGKLQERLEFEAVRRADLCYCPSLFTAKHYRQKLGREFSVIRTPCHIESSIAKDLPFQLPGRYLLFYGQLNRRKGLDWLFEALVEAFQRDETLRIVIVGVSQGYELSRKLQPLESHRDKIALLYPLPKPQMLRVVRDAEATIAPSLVDNLPNTVIESLTLGVPVIGTNGASIDELVEDGVTGRLVWINDSSALADAILEVWQRRAPFKRGFLWKSEVAQEMSNESAVKNFLRFVQPS